MGFSTNHWIIAKNGNVLVVDFTRRPDPPAPRFPGANALREIAVEEVPTRHALPGGAVTAIP